MSFTDQKIRKGAKMESEEILHIGGNMRRLKFILAGSYQEAWYLTRLLKFPKREIKYVYTRNNILGYKEEILLLYGTWFHRSDKNDIIYTANHSSFQIAEIQLILHPSKYELNAIPYYLKLDEITHDLKLFIGTTDEYFKKEDFIV
jgi:hypothetical protein